MDKTFNQQQAITAGSRINQYEIVRQIGYGGMGKVFIARDVKLDRKVALKFLTERRTTDRLYLDRLIREARAASRLNHPNIVTIYEVCDNIDHPFIAMEYVKGESLKDVLADSELSIDEIVATTRQVCEALSHAHAAGVVHRDIKPANIMISGDGKVKILDFGSARLAGASSLTQTGTTIGTVSYMSPEQVEGEEIDQRSDIFSLGVSLYLMLTGKLPFAGDHQTAVLYSIVNKTPEPPANLRKGHPRWLQQVVLKALSKDRLLRYQSMEEMIADLDEGCRGRSGFVRFLTLKTEERGLSRVAIFGAVLLLMTIILTRDEAQQEQIYATAHQPISVIQISVALDTLANVLIQGGQWNEAIHYLEMSQHLKPDDLFAVSRLANLHFMLGNWPEARQMYQQQFSLEPAYRSVVDIGRCYLLEGVFDSAVAVFDRTLDIDDYDYQVWGYLAIACHFLPERHGDAEMLFNRARQIAEDELRGQSGNAQVLADLALYAAATGADEDAVAYSEDAQSLLRPSESETLITLAAVHKLLGHDKLSSQLIAAATVLGISPHYITSHPFLAEQNPDESEPVIDSVREKSTDLEEKRSE